MHAVINPGTDPYFNVALDSWLVREAPADEDYVMLWQNRPAVIIGRYQNTHQEVHVDYANAHGIAIVRRMSGGGAVYHDLGNLNFSMIVSTEDQPFNDFQRFVRPVVETLAHYGVTAELTGRNDVTLDGKKFSGNAQYRTPTRLLHHGTILFNENLDDVRDVLNVNPDKIEGKGIKSVRSRVTNVQPYLPKGVGLDEFRATLLQYIGQHNGGVRELLSLNWEQQRRVQALVDQRFGQWDWNFGQSPAFNYRGQERFGQGAIEALVYVVQDHIKSLTIYGDFLGDRNISPLIHALTGLPYSKAAIRDALSPLPVSRYLGGIGAEQLLKVLMDMTPVP